MGDGQLLIRLTTTVSNHKNFCTLIWADNVKEIKTGSAVGLAAGLTILNIKFAFLFYVSQSC